MNSIVYKIILILFIFGTPFLLNKYLKGTSISKIFSPIVTAYLLGILVKLFDIFPIDTELNSYFIKGTILLAIPLLLFNTDVVAWLKHAKSTIISFIFCIVAAILSTVLYAFVFNNSIDHVWEKSGMLLGILTGGTANLNAVGIGVGATEDSIIILNTAEILWGGLYLIILTSIAPKLYGWLLPEYNNDSDQNHMDTIKSSIKLREAINAILLSIVVVILSVGSTILIFGDISNQSFLILMLSLLSVIGSFYKPIRNLSGSFEAGDYLLLMFCIAIGMTFDLTQLIESGGSVFIYTGLVMFTSIMIHLVFSKLFKIDRDTTIITSTAAIYGPAFIGQVANVLNNRQIIFAGISTSLIGYAVGNFLGISLSSFLQQFLS